MKISKAFAKDLKDTYEKTLNLEPDFIKIPGTEVDYWYSLDDGKLEIHFEWSDGVVDWINNFRFKAKPYSEMRDNWKVHGGFLECWDNAKLILAPLILNPTVKSIKIVGYSHGAALAVLCHEFCVFNRPELFDNIIGYGYGCPRVVSGWFTSKKIKNRWKNFYVIRNHTDIVTHVPPVLFGFVHVGNMVKVGKKLKLNSVDSHRPQYYVQALQELYDSTK